MQRLFVIAIFLAPLVGCSASSPEGETLPGVDAGGPGDDVPVGEGDKPELSVDQPDASTPYLSIPITGTGPANGTIIVESAIGSVASDIRNEGTFCVDVPLQEGIQNTFWLKAMNDEGIYSEEVEVTVRQEGEPPDGENEEEEPPDLRNIAKYGNLEMNVFVRGGEASYVNDGDPTTFTRIENNEWAGTDWIRIELADQAPIERFRVRSTDECTATDYVVLMTDEPAPDAPTVYQDVSGLYAAEPWSLIEHVTNGTGDDVIAPALQSQPVGSYMALVLRSGCTWFTQEFEIQEIEAFTRDDATSPTSSSGGPSCASGGPR